MSRRRLDLGAVGSDLQAILIHSLSLTPTPYCIVIGVINESVPSINIASRRLAQVLLMLLR